MALYTAEIERQWIFAISSLFLSLLHLEEQWNIPRYTCVPLSIPKCLPIFSKFFRINGKKENLNSRNTYLEIFLRFPYKLFVSIKRRDYFHPPFPSFHFSSSQTWTKLQTWKRPRRIPQEYFPPRENVIQDFTSSWIFTRPGRDEPRTILNSMILETVGGEGWWPSWDIELDVRPTMRTRDRVAREDRVRVNRTATMGGIRWREVNLLGGFVNRGARCINWEIIALYFLKERKERLMVKKSC